MRIYNKDPSCITITIPCNINMQLSHYNYNLMQYQYATKLYSIILIHAKQMEIQYIIQLQMDLSYD